MNCEQFVEQLDRRCHESEPSVAWEKHREQCAMCRELATLVQRLQHEAQPASPRPAIDSAALLTKIRARAARTRQRRKQLVAAASCAAIVLALLMARNFWRDKDAPTPRRVLNHDVAIEKARPSSEHIVASAQRQNVPASNTSSAALASLADTPHQVRPAIVRLVDPSGNVHECPVLIVSGLPRKVAFDDLSPLERQMVRRYLQMQGRTSELTSL